MFCPRCGQTMAEGTSFCSSCGSPAEHGYGDHIGTTRCLPRWVCCRPYERQGCRQPGFGAAVLHLPRGHTGGGFWPFGAFRDQEKCGPGGRTGHSNRRLGHGLSGNCDAPVHPDHCGDRHPQSASGPYSSRRVVSSCIHQNNQRRAVYLPVVLSGWLCFRSAVLRAGRKRLQHSKPEPCVFG